MIEVNYKVILYESAIAILLCFLVVAMTANSGCVSAAKKIATDAVSTPVPTPTPTPIPTPTPTPVPTVPPTPKAIQTIAPHYVDPFLHGERWEDQWFKWRRNDVQGYKDLYVGIVVYRHAFMDKYTWWNAATGNYQEQKPASGNRYLAVWVHEEMLGDNSTYDPSMWIFDENAFRVQVKGRLCEPDQSHNPVNRILEFDQKYDYYDTVTAGPFAWDVRYSGFNPETAGYVAERRGWLRWGEGNAVDGYILFEIPKDTMEQDVLVLGSFSRFGNAYWRIVR